MSARSREKQRRERLPPFVALLRTTIDSDAWRAMSHGAQSLYVALRRRYRNDLHNNGRIFLSQRVAAKEINSHHNEIARWFRELQHYGFIEMTSAGCLGLNGRGKAPHWRLTECGYMREPPTNDFLRWDGSKFRNTKAASRTGNSASSLPETARPAVLESQRVHS
jgi:hypothetical protein